MTKSIYMVLSQSGSMPSRLLKFFTKDEYNHVSISLTPTLETMYSFGRINPYNPLVGGFVEEGKNIGTFKRFKNTMAEVYEIKVNEETFNNIKYFIGYFKENKEKFKYNYFGVLLAGFKLNWQPQHKLYCSQFVNIIFKCFKIGNFQDLPKVAKPMHFLRLNNKTMVYKGLLKNYTEKTP